MLLNNFDFIAWIHAIIIERVASRDPIRLSLRELVLIGI